MPSYFYKVLGGSLITGCVRLTGFLGERLPHSLPLPCSFRMCPAGAPPLHNTLALRPGPPRLHPPSLCPHHLLPAAGVARGCPTHPPTHPRLAGLDLRACILLSLCPLPFLPAAGVARGCPAHPPTHPRDAGLDRRACILLSLFPWVVMAVGSSAAGLLADHLVSSGVSVTRVRKGVQTVAFLGPVAALVMLGNPAISPPAAVACLAAALGITSLGQVGGWRAGGRAGGWACGG